MKLTSLSMLLASLFVASYAAPTRAEGQWDKNHPRRHEVNKRLHNQKNRVNAGEKDGSLTKQQGRQISKEDRHIRREERRMAAKDGGHITKADQAKLNRQENRVSDQINKDEAANKAAAPAPTPAPAPAQ